MNRTDDELKVETELHAGRAAESFREGREIHQDYILATEKQSLTDEVEKFTDKLDEGISEIEKVIHLQDEYLNRKSN